MTASLGAVGMLGTLTVVWTIDAFGPVSDNEGGVAEMSRIDGWLRERTDALNAAGNITVAIGKGVTIGYASLVSFALFGTFCVRAGITGGAKSVRKTPNEMVKECTQQFYRRPQWST